MGESELTLRQPSDDVRDDRSLISRGRLQELGFRDRSEERRASVARTRGRAGNEIDIETCRPALLNRAQDGWQEPVGPIAVEAVITKEFAHAGPFAVHCGFN